LNDDLRRSVKETLVHKLLRHKHDKGGKPARRPYSDFQQRSCLRLL
jgi:hypothetical protein